MQHRFEKMDFSFFVSLKIVLQNVFEKKIINFLTITGLVQYLIKKKIKKEIKKSNKQNLKSRLNYYSINYFKTFLLFNLSVYTRHFFFPQNQFKISFSKFTLICEDRLVKVWILSELVITYSNVRWSQKYVKLINKRLDSFQIQSVRDCQLHLLKLVLYMQSILYYRQNRHSRTFPNKLTKCSSTNH